MRVAAVALLNGWADPLALLALPPADWLIATTTVMEADRIALERARARDEGLAQAISSLTIRKLGRALKSG